MKVTTTSMGWVGSKCLNPSLSCPIHTGNRGVYTDSSLGLVLYYHYADTNVGLADSQYVFGWNQLKWSNGWPYV